jgi:hypothetical protein
MVAELFEVISHPQVREILFGNIQSDSCCSNNGSDDSYDSGSFKCSLQGNSISIPHLLKIQEIMTELEARIKQYCCAGDWKPEKIIHVLNTVFDDMEQNQQELIQLLDIQKSVSVHAEQQTNQEENLSHPKDCKSPCLPLEFLMKLESSFQVNNVQRAMLFQVIGELVKILLMHLSRSKVVSVVN